MRKSGKYKGPKMGSCMVYSRDRKKATVTGAQRKEKNWKMMRTEMWAGPQLVGLCTSEEEEHSKCYGYSRRPLSLKKKKLS